MPITATPDRPRYLELHAASEVSGLSEKTLRRRISDGSIAAYRVGPRAIRIREDLLFAFIESQTIGNAASV